MWLAEQQRIIWQGDWNTFSFPVFSPDYNLFLGEIVCIPLSPEKVQWYDDWTQKYPRHDEVQLISDTLDSLRKNPRRVHIAGISCIESVELIRDYYASLGYEDELAKNYIVPADTFLTVSVSLGHLLWCEKDKIFLKQKDAFSRPYYAVVPPLRSPRDLRSLQQAVRMGIVQCIRVWSESDYIIALLERQVLTPFQLTRSIGYNWTYYGFLGQTSEYHFSFPDFSSYEEGDID